MKNMKCFIFLTLDYSCSWCDRKSIKDSNSEYTMKTVTIVIPASSSSSSSANTSGLVSSSSPSSSSSFRLALIDGTESSVLIETVSSHCGFPLSTSCCHGCGDAVVMGATTTTTYYFTNEKEEHRVPLIIPLSTNLPDGMTLYLRRRQQQQVTIAHHFCRRLKSTVSRDELDSFKKSVVGMKQCDHQQQRIKYTGAVRDMIQIMHSKS